MRSSFRSNTYTIINNGDISSFLNTAFGEILNKIDFWLEEGSAWQVEKVLDHYVNITQYVPLRGRSYLPLPEELKNPKKGLINLKNDDNKCFLWCHVRHLNPQEKNANRIKLEDREFAKRLDYSGITFPVTVNQIPKIEKQNKININLFGYDKSPYPIYISKARNIDHLDLLYIEKEEEEVKQHYVYIKDFNRFMYHFSKHKEKKHFCKNCFQCFYSEDVLAKHITNCIEINGVQAVEMPKPYIDKNGVERAPCVYFQNHHRQLPVPFEIIADFECNTEKVSICKQSDSKSYTENIKSTRLVLMVIKLFAIMTRSIQEIQ